MHDRLIVIAASLLVAATALVVDAREGTLRARLAGRLHSTPTTPGTPGLLRAPGTYRYTLQHRGRDRAYLVHVPRSYDSSQPMAAVFALHGGGGDMAHMAGPAYGIVAKAEREGFIAVFPNGSSRRPDGRLATWNAGDCCGDARDRASDDVGFVRGVHADVARRLSVDRRRVFAMGMSNGGMMAYRLACEAADLFRATASVAGTDVTRNCAPSRAVPVLHIHALDDSHVLYGGGAGVDAFRDRSKVSHFPSVAATIAKWSRIGGCPAPRRLWENPGAWCDTSAPCRAGAAIQVCSTRTGGHTWPGGRALRGGTPSSALSANEVIWAFFQRS